jgi:hypothetical protein
VVSFLLGLDHVPVGKAVQSLGLEVVGKAQIEISGVEFLVDLGVEKLVYGCVHGASLLYEKLDLTDLREG